MITLHLPRKENFEISKEISLARNIKDAKNRKDTIAGLTKIQKYL